MNIPLKILKKIVIEYNKSNDKNTFIKKCNKYFESDEIFDEINKIGSENIDMLFSTIQQYIHKKTIIVHVNKYQHMIKFLMGYKITLLDVIDIFQTDIELLKNGSISEEEINKQYNFTKETITHLYKIKQKSIQQMMLCFHTLMMKEMNQRSMYNIIDLMYPKNFNQRFTTLNEINKFFVKILVFNHNEIPCEELVFNHNEIPCKELVFNDNDSPSDKLVLNDIEIPCEEFVFNDNEILCEEFVFRYGQKNAYDKFNEMISNKKYWGLMIAPTGWGKSMMHYLFMGSFFKKCNKNILLITKRKDILQDVIKEIQKEIIGLKNKNMFPELDTKICDQVNCKLDYRDINKFKEYTIVVVNSDKFITRDKDNDDFNSKKLDKIKWSHFGLVLFDEVHWSGSKRNVQFMIYLKRMIPFGIGSSATPIRRSLQNQKNIQKLYGDNYNIMYELSYVDAWKEKVVLKIDTIMFPIMKYKYNEKKRDYMIDDDSKRLIIDEIKKILTKSYRKKMIIFFKNRTSLLNWYHHMKTNEDFNNYMYHMSFTFNKNTNNNDAKIKNNDVDYHVEHHDQIENEDLNKNTKDNDEKIQNKDFNYNVEHQDFQNENHDKFEKDYQNKNIKHNEQHYNEQDKEVDKKPHMKHEKQIEKKINYELEKKQEKEQKIEIEKEQEKEHVTLQKKKYNKQQRYNVKDLENKHHEKNKENEKENDIEGKEKKIMINEKEKHENSLDNMVLKEITRLKINKQDISNGLVNFKNSENNAILLVVGRANEGFNDPLVDICVNMDFSKNNCVLLTLQKMGRAQRLHGDKQKGYYVCPIISKDTEEFKDILARSLYDYVKTTEENSIESEYKKTISEDILRNIIETFKVEGMVNYTHDDIMKRIRQLERQTNMSLNQFIENIKTWKIVNNDQYYKLWKTDEIFRDLGMPRFVETMDGFFWNMVYLDDYYNESEIINVLKDMYKKCEKEIKNEGSNKDKLNLVCKFDKKIPSKLPWKYYNIKKEKFSFIYE